MVTVSCDCGFVHRVNIDQCGNSIRCQSCGILVKIPLFLQDENTDIKPPAESSIIFDIQSVGHISYMPALCFAVLAILSSLILMLIPEGRTNYLFSHFVDITSSIGYAFWIILHYKCWETLPQRFRYTTPLRAVGYSLIPIFNLYWAFITYPKLALGYRGWQKELRLQTDDDIPKTSSFLATFSFLELLRIWFMSLYLYLLVINYVTFKIPTAIYFLLGSITVLKVVYIILFYARLGKIANELVDINHKKLYSIIVS